MQFSNGIEMKEKTLKAGEWAIKLGDEITAVIDVSQANTMSQNLHFFKKKHQTDQLVIAEDQVLNYSEVEPMIAFLGYNQKESATFLEVNPGTISRWKKNKNKIGRLRTKNVLDVDEIIAKGIRIFGSEEKFKEWLHTSNYALGDVAPIELLKDPYGIERVEEAIDGLSYGTYI